ncbi:medium chain dehydrogenase/reductase family protein [Streptomyces xiamenensis]|uniref:medium chain dehydrogenase/reductase family protein n=1 Tax=Streptomyces xiamenensis TaxID=408015 RepID=UPI0037D89C29
MTTTTATEVVLPGPVEPAGFQLRRREIGPPAPGQALLRVEASGVSFAEQQMRRGTYFDQPAYPFVPGYDCVGVVTAVGDGVDTSLVGRRVAALTKTGGWASAALLDARDLVPIPDGVGPAEAETLVVNGLTAWGMLHRTARIRPGQTVLVHGANGGVGTLLVQLARHAGARVIGTCSARHTEAVRALGAEPVDYRAQDLHERIRALAPHGVQAVFDHVGGPGIVRSWRLLARGGTLVAYGSASTRDDPRNGRATMLLVGRLLLWNALPNDRRAAFFNVWAGRRRARSFRARQHRELTAVLRLLADGVLTARIAARVPLTEAPRAMELAESGTVVGKVVLVTEHTPG